jgi:hypothetical protein
MKVEKPIACLNYSRQHVGAEKVIAKIIRPNLTGKANNLARLYFYLD